MDCNNNYFALATHLNAMARKSGVLIGLPIVAVETGYESQALQCDDGLPRTFESLMLASIGVDSCGKPALRVKFINSCETHLSCKIGGEEEVFYQMFAYEPSTKTFALVINQSS